MVVDAFSNAGTLIGTRCVLGMGKMLLGVDSNHRGEIGEGIWMGSMRAGSSDETLKCTVLIDQSNRRWHCVP